ncbi:MAG: M36 family metallopeptidase, partial [Lewinella sp.]
MKRIFTNFLLLLLLGATAGIAAQDSGKQAIDYLQKEYAVFGLEATDVADIKITDDYASPNGTRHIYVVQRLHGLPILNASASLHFRGDRLVHRTSDLATNLASVLPIAPAFSAQTAAGKAVNEVTSAFGTPVAIGTDENGEQLFSWEEVSPKAIRVSSGWYITDAGPQRVFQVYIDQHASRSQIWKVLVDARDGRIIGQENMVLTCSFGPARSHRHDLVNGCKSDINTDMPVSEQLFEKAFTAPAVMVEDSRYHVVPFGEESPIHGERTMEVSPAHPIASPFGWHDVDGEEGAEFTNTRGNNAYAYRDIDGNDNPDAGITAEGGDSLVFDFPYAASVSNDSVVQAGMVQSFYTVNKMHDWLYVAGFDEAAGNFQRNNYTDDGFDRDEVLIETQDNFIPADPDDDPSVNNANFSTPPDGSSGAMQMFLWTRAGSVMSVSTPASISGDYNTGLAQFGPAITSTPITGQVAISEPAIGCTELTNDLTGKIALVTRGECNFSLKVFNAQQAGAVAAIICNDAMEGTERGGLFGMTDGNPELDKNIPSVFITFESCVELRNRVAAGDSVSVTLQTPPPVDGAFDNGIVAHELGHGVSNRLVGGPNNTGCLPSNNANAATPRNEQMGEGWSDFFTLASTPFTNTDTPDGTEVRGIGNFATQNEITARGIRSLPYSTDFTINGLTYDDVITTGNSQHNLGEIWAATLWDLYWALTNEQGLDPDLIDGTGGNNLAVQLVIEGMKRTACRPGLVDGRDGILAADLELYNGANQCTIWDVFARRGLGFSADQGTSAERDDNREAFDTPPDCAGGVQLVKTVDANTINAGEGVTFTLKATSYREGATDKVLITEIIPDGMTFEENSVRGSENWTIDGQTLTFDLGTMDFEDEETILYSVSTDPALGSNQTYFDGAEDGDDDWDAISLNVFDPDNPITDIFWEVTDTTPYADEFSWYIVNAETAQDQVLQSVEAFPITGDQPGLRFFTKYDTEAAYDAGIIEVSTDGNNWDLVDDKMVRGNYRGEVGREALPTLRGTNSFWGDSDGFQEIIVDLSDYAGEDVFIRWRLVSDGAARERGWWVDNIELLDIFNYDGTATLTSDAGDNWPATVGELGVLVENGTIDNTNDPVLGQTDVQVYPNPADQFVTVNITSERAGDANVQLLSIDGRVLHTAQLNLIAGG